MNNSCWWWLLLKSNNYLSNRSINYAIIINKCSIACIVKTFSSSLVSSIWLNVAQQNLHSSQTLLHLWNNVFSGCPSGQISYHSGGSWMVFHQCEAFHALSGCPSRWISCHSWIVISRAFIKWLHFSTWLSFLDWISDLMVINECMPVNNKLL